MPATDDIMQTVVPDIDKLFERDAYLRIHEREIRRRYGEFNRLYASIDKAEGKSNFH